MVAFLSACHYGIALKKSGKINLIIWPIENSQNLNFNPLTTGVENACFLVRAKTTLITRKDHFGPKFEIKTKNF